MLYRSEEFIIEKYLCNKSNNDPFIGAGTREINIKSVLLILPHLQSIKQFSKSDMFFKIAIQIDHRLWFQSKAFPGRQSQTILDHGSCTSNRMKMILSRRDILDSGWRWFCRTFG